ncbi:MAG TPA: hypothetical protein VGT43_04355 [Burkholderiales bacterium]|nr:hypothetical protein [Burkholderiales bacterium]
MAQALPSFIPRASANRKPASAHIAVALAVLGAYLGAAALLGGPIQVWLLVLLPFALAAIAAAFRIIDPSDPG